MAMDTEELEEQIKQQVEEWSTNSNDCFTLNLTRSDGSQAATFQPEFTYPIFGEEEAIFGYQDLAIDLSFAAHNLKPHLAVSYGRKFQTLGEVRPTDIHEALRDFLPEVAFSSESVGDALRDEKAVDFTPPGEKVHEYSRDGRQYEIWCARLSDPAARQLLENMQILVPMFIEGGSTLQLDHDWTTQRWKLFLLYEVNPTTTARSPYTLLGYGTSYRIFTFPDRHNPTQADLDTFQHTTQSILDFLPPPSTPLANDLAPTTNPNNITSPLDLPSRERLSQFLILPPFQSAGHGQELYNTMYTHLTHPPNVREFTVEDPNEAFDDLRDLCDLLRLRSSNPDFAALRIATSIPPTTPLLPSTSHIPTDLLVPVSPRQQIQKQSKLQPRQFDRLVEMHTLSHIPSAHRSRNRITRKEKASSEFDRQYYFWRLYVKQRLYIFNRDALAQVERGERVEKVEGALDGVLEGYAKMLERVEGREERAGLAGDAGVAGAVDGDAGKGKRVRKRKVVEEEDEEDEEDASKGAEVAEKVVAVNGHKRPRVESGSE